MHDPISRRNLSCRWENLKVKQSNRTNEDIISLENVILVWEIGEWFIYRFLVPTQSWGKIKQGLMQGLIQDTKSTAPIGAHAYFNSRFYEHIAKYFIWHFRTVPKKS